MTDETHECPTCGGEFDTRRGLGVHYNAKHDGEDAMKEMMLDDLRELAEELGRTPTVEDINNADISSHRTYSKYFESVNGAIQKAGLEPNIEMDISESELLDEVHRLADELGQTPSVTDLREQGRYSSPVYWKRFGSWEEALAEAGYEPRQRASIEDTNAMVCDLQRLAGEHDTNPTQELVRKHGEYSVTAYRGNFGSWTEAKKAAGYDPIIRQDITDQELLDEIRRLGDELGRAPFTTEMKEEGEFSLPTYMNRFGSWEGAVTQAGLEPVVYSGELNHNWKEEREELAYGPGWTEQRRRALERDGHSCTVCGMTSEEHVAKYGQELDVHHIRPLREFKEEGEFDYDSAHSLDNLRTVCRSCHHKCGRDEPGIDN